jgi:LacI family transcriptional regulator
MRPRRRVAVMLELGWPYRRHMDVFLGTQRYAQARNKWECVVDEFADRLLRPGGSGYDGIIARADTRLAERARRAGIPLVNVWHNSPAEYVSAVFPDYNRAGALAAEHLLGRGLRRFVCVMHRPYRTHRTLLQGFHNTLNAAGYECTVCAAGTGHVARGERTWARFQVTLDRWLASWQAPVGVFVAFNDFTARYLVSACRQAGRRVPEEVAVVVADNDLPICLQPPPSLTGIDLQYERVGFEAARLLDRLMKGGRPPAAPVRVSPTGVVGRQSTDFFATDDDLVVAAMRFIAGHLAEPIGVGRVAAAVHASRRTLERRFREAAGRSVFAEVRRLRLERAQRMLLDTDLPIKQIARSSGLGSNMQMYQVFMRFLGTSPSNFRDSRGR